MIYRKPRRIKPDTALLEKELEKAKKYIKQIEASGKKIRTEKLQVARTTVIPGEYHEAETGIKKLKPIMSATKIENKVLIQPGGVVKASVTVPEEFRKDIIISPHPTSTFARLGIDMTLSQSEYQGILKKGKIPKTIEINVINNGKEAVLIRPEDSCRLMNYPLIASSHKIQIKTKPQTTEQAGLVNLHAGNKILKIKENKLPIINLNGKDIRYIDPHSDLSKVFREEKFSRVSLKPGESIVLSAKEKVKIPKNGIAAIESAEDGLTHSRAVLIHSGWKGRPAIELRAYQPVTIKPGDNIARLLPFGVNLERKEKYKGKYYRQTSIKPRKEKKSLIKTILNIFKR